MVKSKGSKGKNVPSRHIHCRLSYLHQAASYLSVARQTKVEVAKESGSNDDFGAETTSSLPQPPPDYAQSRHLMSQLRAVSLKSQTRLAPQVKHSLCKRCSSLLVAGKSSTARMVNRSKGERKPCADVLVLKCTFCGTVKRFPVGQVRKPKGVVTPHGNEVRLQEKRK
jgi:ribonuclease P protein subunit RPR2